MIWLVGWLVWMLLGVFVLRWFSVAVGPKSPEDRRRDDEDQMRALGMVRVPRAEASDVPELVDAALADFYGEDYRRDLAAGDRRVTGHPRSLPRDLRRTG